MNNTLKINSYQLFKYKLSLMISPIRVIALVGVTRRKMKVTALGLIFSTLYVCAFSQSFTFPANEYEFSIRRDALKQAERIFEGKSTDLTEVCNSVVTQLNLPK